MEQIFIHVAGVVLAALVVNMLRLNTKRVVHVQARPVSWVWKAMALFGKFFFIYGLLVFLSNLFVLGSAAPNTALGATFLTLGLISWIVGGLVVYFKRS